MSDPAAFLSVTNFKGIMAGLTARLRGSVGCETEEDLARLGGVDARRFLFKIMKDVQREAPPGRAPDLAAMNELCAETAARFFESLLARDSTFFREEAAREAEPELPRAPAPPQGVQRGVDIGDPFRDFERKYEAAAGVVIDSWRGGGQLVGGEADNSGGDGVGSQSMFIPNLAKKRRVPFFVFLNGLDRDTELYPYRYRFVADLSATNSQIKNVRSVRATKLIVPREIVHPESRGTAVRAGAPLLKTNFRYDFGLPYPYVVLNVAEFENVYKSPNRVSGRAFAHFVFKTSYCSPAGRNYLVLEPVQEETLRFDVNPLAQIGALTVSVVSPSGTLLNASRDDFRVRRLTMAANSTANSQDPGYQVISVHTHSMFDVNEFYRGDVVRLSKFASHGSNASELDAFVNREEGHRILDVPDAVLSTNGLAESFRIAAPGSVDYGSGAYSPNLPLWADIDALNNALDALELNADKSYWLIPGQSNVYYIDGARQLATGPVLGEAVNASLQVSLSLKGETEEDDVTV